jgi:hypothetical protein
MPILTLFFERRRNVPSYLLLVSKVGAEVETGDGSTTYYSRISQLSNVSHMHVHKILKCADVDQLKDILQL